jgi:hypothetical protein
MSAPGDETAAGEPWPEDSLYPWAAAALLETEAQPLNVEGDGLGGEVEVRLDFGPGEALTQAPPAGGQDRTEDRGGAPAVLTGPADERSLIRRLTPPASAMAAAPAGPRAGQDQTRPRAASAEAPKTAGPPPGEELDDGVKVFTLIK